MRAIQLLEACAVSLLFAGAGAAQLQEKIPETPKTYVDVDDGGLQKQKEVFGLAEILRGKRSSIKWVARGDTPKRDQNAIPQGLAICPFREKETLFHSLYFKNGGSIVVAMELPNLARIGEFSMPRDASHTAGLAALDGRLFACDYDSNKLYVIDLEHSIRSGAAVVQRAVPTGLAGTSGLTIAELAKQQWIVVSDFRNSRQCLAVRVADLLSDDTVFETGRALRWRAASFSQGLAWDGDYLYETTNSFGPGLLHRIDLRFDAEEHRVNPVVVDQWFLPGRMPEDAAIDKNGHIWVSDEGTYRIYEGVITRRDNVTFEREKKVDMP